MWRYCRNGRGFTLIELMIVVCILGILAAMAIPRFMQASTRAKQSEAKQILKQIYVNQRTYRQQSIDNSYYITAAAASAADPTAFSDIWVDIGSTARYVYTIEATANTFIARATGNIDDDALEDVWTINDLGVLACSVDDSSLP